MPKIMGSSKISVRYQITIPEDVRKHMKLKTGQTLGFILENNKVLIVSDF